MPRALLEGRDRELLLPLTYVDSLSALKPRPTGPQRQELARGLAATNAAYGHPKAQELARRLADPATHVIVTGQQPGLFGGPLYTLTKMAAAAKWAAALERAGQPAVAVFWVATEDHDYAEVAWTGLFAAAGPEVLELGPDPSPLTPLGMRTLGEEIRVLLEQLQEKNSAPEDQRRAVAMEALARWYRPSSRFGEAFCRLMVHYLGERTPLLLDAMHPALKTLQRPLLRRLVERRLEVQDALQRTEERIRQASYSLQIKPQPDSSPLFLLSGTERRRIKWSGESSFTLRGAGETEPRPVEELLRTIEENPAAVSPGALARPVLQDSALGTTLQVLGPGEMAYMAQAAALYPVLEVEAPASTLRPQIVVLDHRQLTQMAGLGIGLGDLLGEPAHLDRLLAEQVGANFVEPVRNQIQELLDSLHDPAVALDGQLRGPWQKTSKQVLKALELFAGKVMAATARKDETQHRRLEALRTTCLPLGRPQERVLSTSYFPTKFGPGFVEALWSQLDLDPGRLQVICPQTG